MKIFALIPRNFNLSKKLIALMLAIFFGGVIVSSFVYYNILLGNAENELNRQSNTLISMVDAIRRYNRDEVTTLLEKLLENQSEKPTLLQGLPSVAAAKVFNILTENYPNYGEYIYRNAMINPTNLKDEATYDERQIVKKLSLQQDKLAEKNEDKIAEKNTDRGFLRGNRENKLYYYTARPIVITQPDCLSCHTSLEKSPKSLQALYKLGNYINPQGFGWKLNEVIGTKIVYVPASKVYEIAYQNFIVLLGVFIAIFAVSILLVNLWLKQYVVRPLNRMAKVADAVSLGDMDADFEKQSNDEVGRLAEAFTRMKTSLEIVIKRLAKKSDRSPDESN